MSALTQAEVMVHPARAGQLKKFHKVLSSLGLEITPIESNDSFLMAELRAKTSLRMPDIAVLNQAIKVNGTVATTDQKLAQAAKDLGFGAFHPN